MTHNKHCSFGSLIVAMVATILTTPALAQSVNESGLWFGDGEGIEVVFKTGKNLAYTEDSPKVHPRLTEHSRRMDQALLKIGEQTYLAFGWGITSPMMVVGDDGLIIIDPPESLEMGQDTLKAFRRVTDKPVKAIVYTHNHFDHVAAVKAFVSEDDVASGKVEIYAHETLMQGVINWASTVGPIEGRRTSYTAAAFLPKGPDGSVNDGIGPAAAVGTVTFIPPTKTFRDQLDVTVAGVRMHLRYVPSETNDEIVAWFPDLKLLNSAEVIQGESFPNVHTIRGTKFRDPVQWVKSIDVLRSFPAEYMVPTHGRPIVGYDNIQGTLTAYRDAIQFVHDQTIRHMNRGLTPDELVEVVELPPHLADHPWIGEFYGTVKHAVRQIYVGYLGWFQADPWALDPLPPVERARRYVALMGGRNAVVKAAQEAVGDGDHTWAAEILSYVIRVDHDDMEARKIKAEAYRRFAYSLVNVNWRNWTLTAAAELDGQPLKGGFAFTSPDVIQAFPAGNLIEMMTTRIDPEKSLDVHRTMGITLPDVGESFGLEIRRGIVQYHPILPSQRDFTIVVDRAYLNRMLLGDVPISGEMESAVATEAPTPLAGLLAGIDSGDVEVQAGSKADVQKFFSYFDEPVDVGSINLIVR